MKYLCVLFCVSLFLSCDSNDVEPNVEPNVDPYAQCPEELCKIDYNRHQLCCCSDELNMPDCCPYPQKVHGIMLKALPPNGDQVFVTCNDTRPAGWTVLGAGN